jgi:hypothetical protein
MDNKHSKMEGTLLSEEEADAVKIKIGKIDPIKMAAALRSYEKFEAKLLMDREAWEDDRREYPKFTEKLWEEFTQCQALRNEALGEKI